MRAVAPRRRFALQLRARERCFCYVELPRRAAFPSNGRLYIYGVWYKCVSFLLGYLGTRSRAHEYVLVCETERESWDEKLIFYFIISKFYTSKIKRGSLYFSLLSPSWYNPAFTCIVCICADYSVMIVNSTLKFAAFMWNLEICISKTI